MCGFGCPLFTNMTTPAQPRTRLTQSTSEPTAPYHFEAVPSPEAPQGITTAAPADSDGSGFGGPIKKRNSASSGAIIGSDARQEKCNEPRPVGRKTAEGTYVLAESKCKNETKYAQ
jgi:hypothetical protein